MSLSTSPKNASPNLSSQFLIGDYLLPLRLVIGWTYFSAFWRRLVLEYKLDPDAAGYVGEKFNHFLPNALGIGPIIEFFVSHPELLWWKLLGFTLFEGVVGMAIMLGFFTRAMGLCIAGLAFGILLGAGWLGTTCLDEWQLSLLGIGGGLTIAWVGGGRYSLDALLARRNFRIPFLSKLDSLCSSLPILPVAAGLFFLTLFTNQVFHGGVWGKLHNKSVHPKVELSNVRLSDDTLDVQFYRYEGADVYGSFAIRLSIMDAAGEELIAFNSEELAGLSEESIHNHFVAKVKPGKHSLILPLGARADVSFQHSKLRELSPGSYVVRLTDISGSYWDAKFEVNG